MPDVDSSAIARIDYDRGERALYVTFVNSGAYVYYGVPERVYKDLLAAPSIGSFYNSYVKECYSWRKL